MIVIIMMRQKAYEAKQPGAECIIYGDGDDDDDNGDDADDS